MAYNEKLAARVRALVLDRPGVSEKAMFGGIAFLLEGKMFIGLATQNLMVRVGPDGHADALAQPHTRPMDFTGRPMVGYVYVDPVGVKTDKQLLRWIERAHAFVSTLPAKKPKAKRAARR